MKPFQLCAFLPVGCVYFGHEYQTKKLSVEGTTPYQARHGNLSFIWSVTWLFNFVLFEIIWCTWFVEDLRHERWFRFSIYKLFASFVFSTKSWSVLNSLNINKDVLFEVIVVFCYLLFIFPYILSMLWTLKKRFTSFNLLPFT